MSVHALEVEKVSLSEEQSLVGTLETWPLPDLLLWLHQSRRTAILRIGQGLAAGVLFFSHGELFRVEWGERNGEEAVIGLLGVKNGSFTLVQRSIPSARPNIQRPTAELLFNCAVAFDERNRVHAV